MAGRTGADRMESRPEISSALRLLLTTACLVVTVAGLRWAAPLLVPLVVAAFIGVVSLPALDWFRRQRAPTWLAVLLIVLIDTVILGAIAWVVVRSAAEVRAALPHYAERLQQLEVVVLGVLHGWGLRITAIPYADLVQPERVLEWVTWLVRGVTNVVSASLLVLLVLVFLLAEAAGLPGKLRRALGERAGRLAGFAPIVEEVQQYLALKTLISLATGVLIALAAALLGVDFPLLWGLLAFVLNFIPNIGSILAAIPAVLVALLQLGPGSAVALAGAYLAVNMLLGNLIEPAVMGRRLGLSTLVVILSLMFWGWIWGIVGMLLALPLTMALKIALESTTHYRWIAVLLGPATLDDAAGAEAAPVPPAAAPAAPTPYDAGPAAATGAAPKTSSTSR